MELDYCLSEMNLKAFGANLTAFLLKDEFTLAVAMKILLLFAKDCNEKRDLKGNAQKIKIPI